MQGELSLQARWEAGGCCQPYFIAGETTTKKGEDWLRWEAGAEHRAEPWGLHHCPAQGALCLLALAPSSPMAKPHDGPAADTWGLGMKENASKQI